MHLRNSLFFRLMISLVALCPCALFAQIPALNSRPGAAYTMYLNFGGFDFTGNWGTSTNQNTMLPFTPGSTPAYTIDGSSAFSATEIANMRNVWTRVAEKYAILNVNVTTIDPAPNGSTFAQRQALYDQTPRLMHTVIGGSGAWAGGGGISYVNVAPFTYATAGINSNAGYGYHTNWVFSGSGTNLQFVAEAAAHEDGHSLKLDHQNRYSGVNKTLEYDTGTGGSGSGTFAPIMGNSYTTQRGLWRIGQTTDNNDLPIIQNDLALLVANSGITGNGTAGFMDSGIGHTTATATPLALTGSTINSTLAAGLIAPNNSTPIALGEANYTTDVFSFLVTSPAANLNVNLNSGRSTITAGVADPGATLNATLRLLNSAGSTIMTANSGVLLETLTTSLAPGQYYLQISSAGGGSNNGYDYFDVGSYFLTGLIVAVPEPGMVAFLLMSVVSAVIYQRRFSRSKTSNGEECLALLS